MSKSLEIWGGVECSIVRIGTEIRNQLTDTGHFSRDEDLDLIAELGIKTLRYPVLWELAQPTRDNFDWDWLDRRLGRLLELQIDPIAGLIHHGSGPQWTHILDPEFPSLFATYAGQVAKRYPWVSRFTPINEPLTTARISGLYGLWHPHGKTEETCLRLVAAQCVAIAKSMTAIRKINPRAQLIQTEDCGRVFATRCLEYQASYENERRWLALDLLAGRVNREHPFYDAMVAAGVSLDHLDELANEPCSPDIIGLDYYLTSDRVIDHRTILYPHETIGGNDRHSYADIAAVRSEVAGNRTGLGPRLDEVWNRYGIPIAVTELHNGCTRDEQLRWLIGGWSAARAAQSRGVDIRAVTSWSLFGAVDWNSMLVRQDDYYEPGAFDTRFTRPHPTAVAHAITKLAAGDPYDHPVLDRPGWWLRNEMASQARPIVLAGFGRLISILERCCIDRRLSVVAAQPNKNLERLLSGYGAWAFVEVNEFKATETAMLSGRYVEGGALFVEVQLPQKDWNSVANAFFDLLVDGAVGEMQLIWSGPANQYGLSNDKYARKLLLTG